MDLHRALRPGPEVTPLRVARASALIGLKQTLPQSLSQMFQRTASRIGVSNPAETRASRLMLCQRVPMRPRPGVRSERGGSQRQRECREFNQDETPPAERTVGR